MKLDLSGAERLDPACLHALAETADALRRPFTELISRLGEIHGDEIEWWVTPLASRNVFTSALYLRCCKLLLATRLAADRAVNEFVVESPASAAALRAALAEARPDISIRVHRGPWRFHTRQLAGMVYRFAAALFSYASQFICWRIVGRLARNEPAAPLVILDTFLYRDSFEGAFRDRHYPGLLEQLTADEKRHVFFLASYYKVRNHLRFFRALRASGANFLVKEQYLAPQDYLYALTHPFRLARFRIRQCELEGIDITPLLNEALWEAFANSGSLEGLLRFRLARRLRDSGIRVRSVLEWFENQEIDHGSVAGFRRFFPEARITGYQGFVLSPHHLNIFPTTTELQAGFLPHRLAVTGEGLVERAKEFCPQLRVFAAPAFRFAALHREPESRPEREQVTILVALPLMRDEAEDVLTIAAAAATALRGPGGRTWRFLLKPHPSSSRDFLATLAEEAREADFEIVKAGFDRLLDDADVLVSSASTVCVQAVARGIPVVVAGNSRGLTLNPIPDGVAKELWSLCHEPSRAAEAMRSFAERDAATIARGRALGREVRERYFAPVTRARVAELLGLEGGN